MQTISQELIVHQFPCLTDNYGFLIHDPVSKETACIDTPDATVIMRELDQQGWRLNKILNTHHHHDHIGGNQALQQHYDCEIYGSTYDQDRIPGITHSLNMGDTVSIGQHQAAVIETPGHTLGHIIYHFQQDKLLFAGDTLFAMGCGRLFEGSHQQMYGSLQIIKSFSKDTRVYCAHEYTIDNAKFALSVEQENPQLVQRYEKSLETRNKQQATIPFLLGEDLVTNPFLLAQDLQEFTRRRQLKDQF